MVDSYYVQLRVKEVFLFLFGANFYLVFEAVVVEWALLNMAICWVEVIVWY